MIKYLKPVVIIYKHVYRLIYKQINKNSPYYNLANKLVKDFKNYVRKIINI